MSNAAKGNTWLEFVEGRLSVFQNGVTKDVTTPYTVLDFLGKQDKKISKMDNRIIYRDAENRYYTFDTQYGRFEYLGERGKHFGEFYIDGNQTKEADKKGK